MMQEDAGAALDMSARMPTHEVILKTAIQQITLCILIKMITQVLLKKENNKKKYTHMQAYMK